MMYIKRFILVFLVLSAVIAALLYYPPVPTRSEPGKTSGKIIFTPQGGIIEVSGAEGASSGPNPNKNEVRWTNIGNAVIKYNVNNVSVGLHLAGDSHEGRVVINESITIPESVKTAVPGTPVKYVGISAAGIVFAEAEISIHYTYKDLNGADENSLVIYRYDNDTQAWSELPTTVDGKENIVSATVNSLSMFAVVSPSSKLYVVDSKHNPLNVTIRIYKDGQVIKEYKNVSEVNTDEIFGDIPVA